jgi:competence protein ComEA
MFGFTRKEQKVLLFLSVSYLAGGAIKVYQDHWQPMPAPPRQSILEETSAPQVTTVTALRENMGEKASFLTIYLNTATKADLERIPGVGAVTALRILSYRDLNGGFRTVEELMNVKGIGPKKMQKIRPYVTIQR